MADRSLKSLLRNRLISLGYGLLLLQVAEVRAAVVLDDSGWRWDKDENRDGLGDLKKIYRVNPGCTSCTGRQLSFHTGSRRIRLLYRLYETPVALGGKEKIKGKLRRYTQFRLLSPSVAGWGISRFFEVWINGQSLIKQKPRIYAETDGEVGKAVYRWQIPEGMVTMTFTVRSGDSRILMSIRIQAQKDITSLETRFLCYPSSLGRKSGKKSKGPGRDRWIHTLGRSVRHDKTVRLEPDESWILYADAVWDRAKRKDCVGPCALLFPPRQAESGEVEVQNYAIRTRFKHPPKQRSLHFLLWPSMQISNSEALTRMRSLIIESTQVRKPNSTRSRNVAHAGSINAVVAAMKK